MFIHTVQSELVQDQKLARGSTGHLLHDYKPKLDIINFEKCPREKFEELPTIQKWIQIKSQMNQGKGLVKLSTYVSHILTFCNTLHLHPDNIVFALDESGNPNHLQMLSEQMLKFKDHLQAGTVLYNKKDKQKARTPDTIEYVRAWSSLLEAHQKPIPAKYGGKGHILSKQQTRAGSYSTIQLTDDQFRFGLAFTNAYGKTLQALYALQHEIMARTESILNWTVDYEIKTLEVNGNKYRYAEIKRFYEKKTDSYWTKLVIDKNVLKILEALPKGIRLVSEQDLEETKIKYTQMLRQFYERLELITDVHYQVGTQQWFIRNRPAYVLRHSGAHLWLRRFNFRYEFVAKLGWESVDVIQKYYASQSLASIFCANVCQVCNPPKDETDNKHYCSIQHAIASESVSC